MKKTQARAIFHRVKPPVQLEAPVVLYHTCVRTERRSCAKKMEETAQKKKKRDFFQILGYHIPSNRSCPVMEEALMFWGFERINKAFDKGRGWCHEELCLHLNLRGKIYSRCIWF